MQRIAQLAQLALTRIRNFMTRGVLTGINISAPYTQIPSASIQLFGGETINGIEFPQEYGFVSYPPVDGTTEVISAFFGGARDHGTIQKAFNRTNSFRAINPSVTLNEGEAALHNNVTGTYVLLKSDGSILIKSATSVTIDTPHVTMTGDLTVDGDILDNATGAHINTDNVRGMRSVFNAHVHPDPQGGNTGAPTTNM